MSEAAKRLDERHHHLGVAPFHEALSSHGLEPLRRAPVTTLQANVGKRCNMACAHCHVGGGPDRLEVMPERVAQRVIELVEASPTVSVVDLTGGAPELNPSFRQLVSAARALGRRVIDRCNLTVLFEPGQADLPEFLADQGAEIVASLPCYLIENVDAQRGSGTFDASIAALRRLNGLGYGAPDGRLTLNLVYNPGDASLPPAQAGLEATYRGELDRRYGVRFNRLLTLTNMPIHRFARELERKGETDSYLRLLHDSFNATAAAQVMCRTLVSVSWEGQLYDCDFNQTLGLPVGGDARTIWEVGSLDALKGNPIATAGHCYGCTAGAGSSCSGALA